MPQISDNMYIAIAVVVIILLAYYYYYAAASTTTSGFSVKPAVNRAKNSANKLGASAAAYSTSLQRRITGTA
jgi:hypothetical protein